MSDYRRKLALEASEKALNVRRTLRLGLVDPASPLDIAEQLGIDVRFYDLASLEGIYCRSAVPLIVLSSQRPRTRQVFTCAHELGHHIFRHSTRLDEAVAQSLQGGRFDEREFLADSFAGLLLMPKSAVERAFALRQWPLSACTATQIYTVACSFGVGYETLIHHMTWALRIMSPSLATRLLREPLKHIRAKILGTPVESDLIVVDQFWKGRAIDVNVGDLILVPSGATSDGSCTRFLESISAGNLLETTRQGICVVEHSAWGWSETLRVSRPGYVGLAVYRHREDPDDEQ